MPHAVRSRWIGLFLWIALCVGGGVLVGLASVGGDSAWYQGLAKPGWNPPTSVFAPVWTTLYALMGTAAWRVWSDGGWVRRASPLTLFSIQLALNFLWSILFFNLQSLWGALVDIVLLWTLLVLTIRAFRRVDRVAGWLLVPYLMWVSFATALNAAVAFMN
jgi:tryptophan-rich sensory protein